ncbi:ABC transporter ATP-binding protein [Pseudooceanicola sediminis]|uniref:ABC transporter ATP-binding protein n=1 Tax=Pseudooceanicola sediminis TaxID=2211117 RepID=A0A399J2D8_9RHOB|nr:ABC transporter ATP-binding protein [Pseudooceanicola sediminis]KAA2313993.1 ABC transporter ATP-binding protein [Puniceibacterium sp. HSS470]RII38807.1 ABC transporter ATP-binding protein [Pseudooceanicola sediminis]|tara:strand:+ start:67746 stop:68846 length:1101 start_codon:yes stop_codon:yes gene_type:complete
MRGRDVQLEGVSITYPNGYTAVHPTDLHVRAGEFFSILGPSGCGKTTILRAVSGFVAPSAGRILIGGADQRGIGPNARPTALIFQNLALFPLMPVWENVAFGLEARGMPRRKRRDQAQSLLDLVALGDQGDKLPSDLSGGQRQRVAIARALAVEPAVLLLDEPLSALDLKLRQHMRTELRDIQKKTGVTFIYITHDQGEALTMSDRIAVMNAGVIEQTGTGDEIYSRPVSAFVASFVGEGNTFHGRITRTGDGMARIDTPAGALLGRNPAGLPVGTPAILFVRPERMAFGDLPNAFDVTLLRRDLEGAFVNFTFRTADGRPIALHQSNLGQADDAGQTARIGFAPDAALILPEGPMARTGQELASQ